MKVRVQVSSIIYRGRETTEFYVFGRRISLRNEDFKFGKKNTIIIEKSLAEKNRMKYYYYRKIAGGKESNALETVISFPSVHTTRL